MSDSYTEIHCVLGQAGSGKSTFIDQHFPKDEHIFYNVGSILRKMFGASIGKKQNGNKNTWDFADSLVYNIFDHCHHISRTHNIPMVSDGFPRNVSQLDYMDNSLRIAEYHSCIAEYGNVKLNFHLLDIYLLIFLFHWKPHWKLQHCLYTWISRIQGRLYC